MVKAKKRKTAKRKVRAVKRKPVKRRRVKRIKVRRRVGTRKKSAPKKRRRRNGRKVVKQVERRSVERVMTGKRKRRRRNAPRRKVRMAGRRRSVGGKGDGTKLLLGLAIGAGAIYLLTRGSQGTPTLYPGTNYQLPPLASTSNYTRNTQSQDVVNYALAAGLAADAITKLIQQLNGSSDQQARDIYDHVSTTNDFSFIA